VYPRDDPNAAEAIALVNADRDRLYDGEFLNDNLVNLYFKYQLDLARAAPAADAVGARACDKMHVFSTFFYTKMLEVEDRVGEDSRQTRTATVS
jgi:Ulp1 family protease